MMDEDSVCCNWGDCLLGPAWDRTRPEGHNLCLYLHLYLDLYLLPAVREPSLADRTY